MYCFRWNIITDVYVQDTVHIATKLKTRMLNPKIEMTMGSFKVSSVHVQFIIPKLFKR